MSPDTEKIFEMVKVIIAESDFSFDQTRTGLVTEILTNNKYRVQVQGDTYTIKSQFCYAVGERVFVLFPCGRSTDLYLYPNKYNVITSNTEPNLSQMADGDVWIKTI